jgi:hypothetical protein
MVHAANGKPLVLSLVLTYYSPMDVKESPSMAMDTENQSEPRRRSPARSARSGSTKGFCACLRAHTWSGPTPRHPVVHTCGWSVNVSLCHWSRPRGGMLGARVGCLPSCKCPCSRLLPRGVDQLHQSTTPSASGPSLLLLRLQVLRKGNFGRLATWTCWRI